MSTIQTRDGIHTLEGAPNNLVLALEVPVDEGVQEFFRLAGLPLDGYRFDKAYRIDREDSGEPPMSDIEWAWIMPAIARTFAGALHRQGRNRGVVATLDYERDEDKALFVPVTATPGTRRDFGKIVGFAMEDLTREVEQADMRLQVIRPHDKPRARR